MAYKAPSRRSSSLIVVILAFPWPGQVDLCLTPTMSPHLAVFRHTFRYVACPAASRIQPYAFSFAFKVSYVVCQETIQHVSHSSEQFTQKASTCFWRDRTAQLCLQTQPIHSDCLLLLVVSYSFFFGDQRNRTVTRIAAFPTAIWFIAHKYLSAGGRISHPFFMQCFSHRSCAFAFLLDSLVITFSFLNIATISPSVNCCR